MHSPVTITYWYETYDMVFESTSKNILTACETIEWLKARRCFAGVVYSDTKIIHVEVAPCRRPGSWDL